MRLTLRTLLAYMDDILDPADQEELGRKIESSPFATELIHRSRDAVRRVRLSAPDPLAGADNDIHGGDHNLDANTAAEYLDNVLSPEAVADFERSCLEAGPNADMLLAEAASCHHVLTMVLGEPAEVDADLRQRMYALAQSPAAAPQARVEPAPTAAPVAQQPIVAAAGVAPTRAAATRAPAVDPDEAGVPDYILAAARGRRRTRRMVAAVIGAVLVGVGLTWLVMSGGDVQTPEELAAIGSEDEINQGPQVGDAEGPSTTASTGADAETTAPADPGSQAPPFNPEAATASSASPPPLNTPTLDTPPLATETPAEVTLPPEVPAEGSTAEATAPATEPGTEAAVGTLPAETADAAAVGAVTASSESPLSESTSSTADQAATADATAAAPMAPAETGAATDAAPTESGPAAGEVAAAASASPSPTVPPVPAPETTTSPSAAVDSTAAAPAAATDVSDAAMADAGGAAAGTETPAGAEATTAPAESVTTAQPKPIGAYLGNNDVLLMFNPSEKAWIRLPPRSGFMGGEQLLALPTFRTHVVLADVNAYLSDGTQLELVRPGQSTGEASELAVHIPFGRVLLNSGLSGNRIELSLVDQTRVIQLGPSSSLAIEVRRIFVPGPLDRREPAPTEVYWYLTSGSAKWGDSGSAEAPATWTTIDGADSVPAAIEELPVWVDREPISDLERRARERISEALVPDEPVNVRLLELSDPTDRGRRTEDRALAARSGAYVGLYDPLVTALSDVNQRASWRTQVEGLRQAIARDPSSVEGIHAAFALERGPEVADDLMEMLLGFDRAAVGTTREEVQQGAVVRLLRWMKDDDLLYRVLAAHNVNEILGTRDIGGYKPEQTASQRDRMLNRIWERFERGELMPPAERNDE